MKKIPPIHPGEILSEEFLIPYGITAAVLAREFKVTPIRISQIIKGKLSITVDTALRLSFFFGNSPEFWLGLQTHFDIETAKDKMKKVNFNIRPLKKVA